MLETDFLPPHWLGTRSRQLRFGTMETEGAWACSRGQHPVPYHPHPAVESTDLEQGRPLRILSLGLREERVIKKNLPRLSAVALTS